MFLCLHAHNAYVLLSFSWSCFDRNVSLSRRRLREERAAERRKQEADAGWRQLLRSIWTRLRLHQDYGDNAAAHAGQDHAHQAVAGVFREDLSGKDCQRRCVRGDVSGKTQLIVHVVHRGDVSGKAQLMVYAVPKRLSLGGSEKPLAEEHRPWSGAATVAVIVTSGP